MRILSNIQAFYVKFLKTKVYRSKYSPKSNYKTTLRHLSRKHIIANPEKAILKRTTALCSLVLILTSITPAEPLIASNFDLDGSYNSYLNQEDIAYNQSQIIATSEGFLLKSMPFADDRSNNARLTFQIHTVQKNEKLSDIAKIYGLSTETIVWENSIVNLDDIVPGQELSIPPIDGLTHTVSKGESLTTIANKYKVDFYDIERFNVVNTRALSLGTELFVPGGTRVTKKIVADSTIQPTPTAAKVAHLTTDIDATVLPNLPEEKTQADQINRPSQPSEYKIDSIQNFTFEAIPSLKPLNTSAIISNILSQKAPASQGPWGRPTLGAVTQGYSRSHYALDIADTSKPLIWATADGVVEIARNGWNGGYGNYIIVNHKTGYKTLYAHNEILYVKPGDVVSKGQPIAKMGRTGRVRGATGIHLHYECHKGGIRINPYKCMP